MTILLTLVMVNTGPIVVLGARSKLSESLRAWPRTSLASIESITELAFTARCTCKRAIGVHTLCLARVSLAALIDILDLGNVSRDKPTAIH